MFPDLPDSVRKQYPKTIEPPNVPSQAQLDQRAIFKAAILCWDSINMNEREAWRTLGKPLGYKAFAYFMHYMMPRLATYAVCGDFREPHCAPYDTENPEPFGFVQCRFDTIEAYHFHIKLTIDPFDYEEHYPGVPTGNGWSLVEWSDPDPEPDFEAGSWVGGPSPSSRQTGSVNYNQPASATEHKRWTYVFQAELQEVSILWRFFPDDVEPTYAVENFWAPIL